MAINPETQYPGKIAPSSPDYPYGEARNITVPGDGKGTPWEQALVNDIFGWQQAMLSEAGIVPTSTPEKATASQYLDAIKKLTILSTDYVFTNVSEMVNDGGTPNGTGKTIGGVTVPFILGQQLSTGATSWRVTNIAGVDLGGGLFATALDDVYVVDFFQVESFNTQQILDAIAAATASGVYVNFGTNELETDQPIIFTCGYTGIGSKITYKGGVTPVDNIGRLEVCADVEGVTFSGEGSTFVSAGFWVDLDSIDPVRKMVIKADARDIRNDDNTKPAFGVIVTASSGNTFNKYEIDVHASAKRIQATANGVIGDSGGAAKGVFVSINKAGQTNDISVIKPFVESVYPAEDGDGVHMFVADHTDPAQLSSYRVTDAIVKDCAKRLIKIQAPNCKVISPWMDSTLQNGSGDSTTLHLQNFGVNCTVSNPTMRNEAASFSGDGIVNEGANFVMKGINASLKFGRNIFRNAGGTYDVRGGVVEAKEVYVGVGPSMFLIEGGTGYLDCPTVKKGTLNGSAVRYQSATGDHVLKMSKSINAQELVTVNGGDVDLTIERLKGNYGDVAVNVTGTLSHIQLLSSHLETDSETGTGVLSTSRLTVKGDHYIECGVHGILAQTGGQTHKVEGQIEIVSNAGGGGNFAVRFQSAVKSSIRGVTSENFNIHASVVNSDGCILEGLVARGGGTAEETTGATNLVTQNNMVAI